MLYPKTYPKTYPFPLTMPADVSAPAAAPGPASDSDLLAAWHHHRDPEALRAMCDRHCGLVESCCRRAHSPDVEEAVQAVFLILSRRANAVAGPKLGGWLAATAKRVVANQHRAAARRRRHEQDAAVEQARTRVAEDKEVAWDEARPHLDDALASLSAGRREAILRFYLAGRPQAEIAAELGCSVGAVKVRVHEGLESLRTFFKRKGITVGANALAAGLTRDATASTKPLVELCLHTVHHPATAPGAAAIAQGISTTMVITSAAIAAATCTLVGSGIAAALMFGADAVPATVAAPPERSGVVPAAATRTLADPPAAASASDAAVTPTAKNDPSSHADVDGNAILDPEHARLLLVATAPSVPRLVAALKQLPEYQLIPEASLPVLAPLFGVQDAHIVFDPLTNLPHPYVVATWRSMTSVDGRGTAPPPSPEAAYIPGDLHAGIGFVPGSAGDAAHAWFAAEYQRNAVNGARLDDRPTGMTVDLGPPRRLGGDAILDQFAAMPASAPHGDLDLACLLDPGLPGRPLRPIFHLAFTADASGVHVIMDLRTLRGDAPKPAAPADPAAFDRIPAAALAGAVFHCAAGDTLAGLLPALQAAPATGATVATGATEPTDVTAAVIAAEHGKSATDAATAVSVSATASGTINVQYLASGLSMSLAETDPDRHARLTHIFAALNRIDGDVLVWVQPGNPFPAVCCSVPMPQDAVAQLAAAFGGDVHGFTFQVATQFAIQAGWRDGRIIATTDPAGISVIGDGGGFAHHPEVQKALADMPPHGSPLMMIMRPSACLDQVQPLLDMILPNDQMKPVQAYQDALRTQNGCGWLAGFQPAGDARRVEAGGVLALAAIVAVMNLAQDPRPLLRIAN